MSPKTAIARLATITFSFRDRTDAYRRVRWSVPDRQIARKCREQPTTESNRRTGSQRLPESAGEPCAPRRTPTGDGRGLILSHF